MLPVLQTKLFLYPFFFSCAICNLSIIGEIYQQPILLDKRYEKKKKTKLGALTVFFLLIREMNIKHNEYYFYAVIVIQPRTQLSKQYETRVKKFHTDW